MDRISHLPDDTLSKILSFLQTKDVMRTMLLSKRFKSLWMFVPRLEFDDTTHFPKPEYSRAEPDYGKFRRFVDRSLMSREGQVLQSLHLKLGRQCTDDDTSIWVGTAVKRGLMELKLEYASRRFLPKSLYTCETLVVLKLGNGNLDVPGLVCLRSLKTLTLESMNCSNPSSLLKLLPNCPVLEDLFIQQGTDHQDVLSFKIAVPSLKRLSLIDSSKDSGIKGLVLDAPSLKYLHIVDRSGSLSFSESININEVVKANIEVILHHSEKLLHSLASVEDIRFCLSASEVILLSSFSLKSRSMFILSPSLFMQVVYPVGIFFHKLKHLEVCTCKSGWLDLFMHLLEDSPILKVIKINEVCFIISILDLYLLFAFNDLTMY